jgi:hypothetical protein
MKVQFGLGKLADETGRWPVWRGRHELIVVRGREEGKQGLGIRGQGSGLRGQ